MKYLRVLGTGLSVSLLLAGNAAIADNNKGKDKPKNANAVQVRTDKTTGKKIREDDSDVASVSVVPAAKATIISPDMMPAKAEAMTERADGTKVARLGTENLEYAIVTIDKDGNKSITHQSLKEYEAGSKAEQQEKGDR